MSHAASSDDFKTQSAFEPRASWFSVGSPLTRYLLPRGVLAAAMCARTVAFLAYDEEQAEIAFAG